MLSLGNLADTRVITTTIWATEDARAASGMNRAVIDNVADFGPFVVGSFSRDQYEVLTDTWQLDGGAGDGSHGVARVTTTQLRPGGRDAGVALVREITDRPAGDPERFRGSLALADQITVKVLALEVWDRRATLAAYDSSVFLHDRIEREHHVRADAPVHAIYRVAALMRADVEP
ncbi:MAG TPA: hypothetical protein VMM78_13060 [Thermomicrobiales bacterium]|nr:hypothetical protein [Thermomicrobiales bacterium]